jgi:hypothetical protein
MFVPTKIQDKNSSQAHKLIFQLPQQQNKAQNAPCLLLRIETREARF